MDEENPHTTVYPGKIHALPGLRGNLSYFQGERTSLQGKTLSCLRLSLDNPGSKEAENRGPQATDR